MRIIFFYFLFSIGAHAHNHDASRAIMGGALDVFQELMPYMYGHKDFTDDAGRQEVVKNLGQLRDIFLKAEHVKALQVPSFSPSSETLRDHLEETISTVNGGHESFARLRMQTIASLCITCHAQLPAEYSGGLISALDQRDRGQFRNDFDYAEYLFLLRRYNRAQRYYQQSISSTLSKRGQNPQMALDPQDSRSLRLAIKRILTIHLQINYRPGQALQFLDNLLTEAHLPQAQKMDVTRWRNELRPWASKSLSLRLNDGGQVKKFIEENLSFLTTQSSELDGEHQMGLLIATGVLSKFLSQKREDELTPFALYWLARAERQLNANFFFSLADLYLRDCITKYPHSSFARQCLQEYRESIEFGYTGSGGTDIPQDEMDKIKAFEAIIQKAQGK